MRTHAAILVTLFLAMTTIVRAETSAAERLAIIPLSLKREAFENNVLLFTAMLLDWRCDRFEVSEDRRKSLQQVTKQHFKEQGFGLGDYYTASSAEAGAAFGSFDLWVNDKLNALGLPDEAVPPSQVIGRLRNISQMAGISPERAFEAYQQTGASTLPQADFCAAVQREYEDQSPIGRLFRLTQ